MVGQQAADSLLADLRDIAQQAQNAFGTDSSELVVHPDRRVRVTLTGVPEGIDTEGGPTVEQINTKEQEAQPIAAELRNLGAEQVTINTDHSGWRVNAVFPAPEA